MIDVFECIVCFGGVIFIIRVDAIAAGVLVLAVVIVSS